MSDEECDAFTAQITSRQGQLTDSVLGNRKRELERVLALVKSASPAVLERTGTKPVGKLLLQRLGDASERCRELALTALVHVVDTAPGAVLALLPYAVPVLKGRLVPAAGASAAKEQSEELRVLLVRFAQALVRSAQASLPAYGTDFVLLLDASLQDTAPEVAIAACGCCTSLASLMQRRIGVENALLLAERVTVQVGHGRAAVRLAALDALHVLVLAGAHEHLLAMSAFLHPNRVNISAFYGKEPVHINWLGKLATDHNAGVRARLIAVLADWMLNLRERVDHTPRLLPFMLSGLTDATDHVVDATTTALAALGKAYVAENADRLADAVRFAPNMDPNSICASLIIQDHLSALLPPCLADMRAWTTDVRPRAVALLKALLILAGPAVEQHIATVTAALCNCIEDADPVVAQTARDCCVAIATNAAPDTFAAQLELLAQANATRKQAITLLRLVCDAVDAETAGHCTYSDALTRVLL